MRYKSVVRKGLFFIILIVIGNLYEVYADTTNSEVFLKNVNLNEQGIFNKEKDGLWEPGNTKVSEFIVYNNSDTDIKLDSISFVKSSDYVTDKSNIIIKNLTTEIYKEGGEYLYEGSIDEVINNSEKIKEDTIIKSGDNEKFIMKININGELGNEGQLIEENLEFLINYTKVEGKFNRSLPETGSKSGQVILIFLGSILIIGGVVTLKLKRN